MRPFLADFHVHTTYSDGTLPISQVIDAFGSQGFGAISITDHIAEETTLIGNLSVKLDKVMSREMFPAYMAELEAEAQRAWEQYNMVVLPGFELSKNRISNRRSAHILGIGIKEYLPADADALELVHGIHAQGGIAVAAHPVFTRKIEKQTYHLWDRRKELAPHFDAWEVASGRFLFDEVKQTKLPKLASSDFHQPKHMTSWKTVLECERHPEAILNAVRRQELDFRYFHPKC